MKILAVGIAVFILTFASAAYGRMDATISITSVQYSVRKSGVHVIHHYLLYNRRRGPTPIGNAVTICQNVGTRNGPFRNVATYCQGTYSIGHNGSIQVEGVSRSPVYFQYAVTGGTGQYFGAGGELTVTVYAQKPRRELLKFTYVRSA